jgi:hypothetical protein
MTSCLAFGRPHTPVAGLLICQRHLDEIGKWLIDLEREVWALDARPSLAIRWDRDGGHALAFERSPVRLNVVVANDRRRVADEAVDHPAGFDRQGILSAFETLNRYAQRVRDERLLVPPVVQWAERIPGLQVIGPFCDDPPCRHESCGWWWRTRPARLTVHTERVLLTRQLVDWIAFQPWVGELHAELFRLREQLQAANGTSDAKPLPGRCPRFDPAGNPCCGRLWPVKPTHSTGTFIKTEADAVHAVQCERDHNHHWEGRDLIRLSLILEDQN